jgi:competence protein ComEC
VKKLHQFVSDNLLCAVTCTFAVGISVARSLPGLSFQIPGLVLTGSLTLFFYRYHWEKSAIGAVLLLFFSLGIFFGSDCYRPPADPSHIYHLVEEKKEAVIIGTLDSLQGYDGRMSRAEINCDSIRFKETKDFIATSGRISLGLKDIWPHDILPGDRIVIRANLSRPHSLQTAGSFNYIHFLAEKGIWIAGLIESPLFIHKTNSVSSLVHTFRYAAEQVRVHIGAAFDQILAPELAGIYKAVVIGEWSGINTDLLEQFKGSGCVHILSISGLHMSIIGVFLFSILYWLLRRSEWLTLHLDVKKTAAMTCLLPLCFYALLAGSSTPVMRSLIMSIVVIFALCVNRRKSIFATLSLAMLCLLAWRPSNLFNVSFQLTFAAVASIAAIFPFLSRLLFTDEYKEKKSPPVFVRFRKWLIAALAVSVAVTVGTAPLLLFSFNRISLVGPLANLVVEPLICFWSLPLGFLASTALFLCPTLASLLLNAGSLGLMASIKAVTFFNDLPLASIQLPTPSPLLTATFYSSLFLVLAGANIKKGIERMAWLVFLISLCFFILPPSEFLKSFTKNSTITFIDVGQGSSALLELPTGKRVLIDGGGPTSPKFNTGERVIGPFLWKKGITKIDAVIITHPDADHYNGLPFIIEHFRPDSLWINGSSGHDREYVELLDLARKLHIQVRVPAGDEQLLQAGSAVVSIIENPMTGVIGQPTQADSEGSRIDPGNDGGLVIKFTDNEFSVVFPGDIGRKAEALLAERPHRLQAEILLSPHHGSSTSNSAVFLQAVHPEFLVVSSGYTHDGIFPARGLAEKSHQFGAKMLTTAFNGCIVVKTDGRGFSVFTGNGISMDRRIFPAQ